MENSGEKGNLVVLNALVFRGIYALNLDGKGRLTIPTRYRDPLMQHCAGHLVSTVDQAGCLLLYPLPDWEDVEQEISRLPSFIPKTRELQRMVIGYASECDMDMQGRILVPLLLRQFAHIDKRIVLAGQGKKFEAWNEDAWMARSKQWQSEPVGDVPPIELSRLSI